MPHYRNALLISSALFFAMPWIASAQVYKWVDEKGVVNYGDKPPARGKAVHPLPENGGSVSVVPGISKEELDQMRERDTQRRVQQLEREVDELRARNLARDQAVPQSIPVEVPAYAYGYPYGYMYPRRPSQPPVTGRPGHRPDHPIATPQSNRVRPAKGSPLELTPAPRSASGRGG